MDDDLDTPGALAVVFDLVRQANGAADAGDSAGAARAAAHGAVCSPRPWDCASGSGNQPTSIRPPRNWSGGGTRPGPRGGWDEADTLRDQLESAGWVVEDGPDGTRIRRQ